MITKATECVVSKCEAGSPHAAVAEQYSREQAVDSSLHQTSPDVGYNDNTSPQAIKSPEQVAQGESSELQKAAVIDASVPTADAADSYSQSEASAPASLKSRKRYLSDSTKEEDSRKKIKDLPQSFQESTYGDLKVLTSCPPANMAASLIDKTTWQGFCEIEHDDAIFSVLLRDMGVRDVTVTYAFGKDVASLAALPAPIYGLIFLYKYRTNSAEEVARSDIWFANQFPAQSSCATLAMLNILMNNSEIELGEHLTQFKDFTQEFTSVQRGEALASFDFVKKIHNSFAKEMDILVGDKWLASNVAHAKAVLDAKRSGTKSRSRKAIADSPNASDSSESYGKNGHHFVAYIPIGNEVWKLDGLNANPCRAGTFGINEDETWLDITSDSIAVTIAEGEADDLDYGILGLVQSPLKTHRIDAAIALNTITAIDARLDTLEENWREFLIPNTEPGSPNTTDPPSTEALTLVPSDLSSAAALLSEHEAISIASNDIGDMQFLLDKRERLVSQTHNLAMQIAQEIQNEVEQDDMARRRRFDAGPVIKKWLEMLTENGCLEELVEARIAEKEEAAKAREARAAQGTAGAAKTKAVPKGKVKGRGRK